MLASLYAWCLVVVMRLEKARAFDKAQNLTFLLLLFEYRSRTLYDESTTFDAAIPSIFLIWRDWALRKVVGFYCGIRSVRSNSEGCTTLELLQQPFEPRTPAL